jgi:hypothetical protein
MWRADPAGGALLLLICPQIYNLLNLIIDKNKLIYYTYLTLAYMYIGA